MKYNFLSILLDVLGLEDDGALAGADVFSHAIFFVVWQQRVQQVTFEKGE